MQCRVCEPTYLTFLSRLCCWPWSGFYTCDQQYIVSIPQSPLSLSNTHKHTHTHFSIVSHCPSDSISVTCSPPQWGWYTWKGRQSNRAPWNDCVTISTAGPQSDTQLNHTAAKSLTMDIKWLDSWYILYTLFKCATFLPVQFGVSMDQLIKREKISKCYCKVEQNSLEFITTWDLRT